MGVSRNGAELATKITLIGSKIANSNAEAVGAAAQVVKDATIPYVRRATGGDLRLSGVGKKGARIGVRYNVRGQANATAIVSATGPAQLVERDVKPHVVTSRYSPKALGRTRARRLASANAAATFNALAAGGGATKGAGWDRRAVIKFGDVVARYAVQSGGSRGRFPYRDGFRAGAKLSPKAYARVQARNFAEVFGA